MQGLNRPERLRARTVAVQAAMLGLHHAAELHYTEGPERWEGINETKLAVNGEYPTHADCSSFVTWCLWNALGANFPDVVNGAHWKAGWTGTLAEHGRIIDPKRDAVLRGDLVLYGNAAPYYHTAIVVGHQDGRPVVVSQGSEAGPFLIPFDYRSDVGEVRRYILAEYPDPS